MAEKIARASGLLLKANAGDKLGFDEMAEAMDLLALPTEKLRYVSPQDFPRHSEQHCKRVLEMSQEERCRMLLDGIRYGLTKRGTRQDPEQGAYRILKLSLEYLQNEGTNNFWRTVLDEYKLKHSLTD